MDTQQHLDLLNCLIHIDDFIEFKEFWKDSDLPQVKLNTCFVEVEDECTFETDYTDLEEFIDQVEEEDY